MHDAAPIESDSDSPDELDYEIPVEIKDGMFAKLSLHGRIPDPCFFCCLRCKNKRPLEKIYRLCAFCVQECNRDPKQEKFWLRGQREQPERPTSAPPGSTEKIGILRRRALRGEELFGAEDAAIPTDWSKVNVEAMLADPIMREAGETGVERDGDNWRARPMFHGEKQNLGMFKSETDAIESVRLFWQDAYKLDGNATPQDVKKARHNDEAEQRAAKERIAVQEDYKRRMAIDHDLYPEKLFPTASVLDCSEQVV